MVSGTADQAIRSLEFSNLPLVEAVVRIYFNPKMRIDFRAVSDLHDQLKDEFPNVAPPVTLETSPALGSTIAVSPGELPGAEYSGGRGVSVHLQSQLLAVRWRRAFSEHAPQYPRFRKLRFVLETALNHVQKTLTGDEAPKPMITNMSYVNFIRVTDPQPYLNSSYLPEPIVRTARVQEQIVAWQRPDGLDLRFEVRGAELTGGSEKQEGFLLVTAVGSKLGPPDDTLIRLDDVHAELQVLFRELISEKAKQEWGLAG